MHVFSDTEVATKHYSPGGHRFPSGTWGQASMTNTSGWDEAYAQEVISPDDEDWAGAHVYVRDDNLILSVTIFVAKSGGADNATLLDAIAAEADEHAAQLKRT